jgi:hypothetical protein
MSNSFIFVLSSGRSGTNAIAHSLNKIMTNASVYHEFALQEIQVISFKYFMRLIDDDEAIQMLESIYFQYARNSKNYLWIDVSNKLCWIAPLLKKAFPDSRFIELIRDGRKVVSSFFNKLNNEMYTEEGMIIIQNYLDNGGPEPEHRKDIWWNMVSPFSDWEYRRKFSRFEWCCSHWTDSHSQISNFASNIKPSNFLSVRLEDLISSDLVKTNFLNFIDPQLPLTTFKELLIKPINVYEPIQHELTESQLEVFRRICGDTMNHYKYDFSDSYKVDY